MDMATNEEADANILVEASESWTKQEEQVSAKVEETLGGEKIDLLICVAGGWAGGNAASKDFIKSCDMMWKQSVWTSVIAGHLAAKHLKENGALSLTGAEPALNGTPGMIGYGMAKGAVHQLVSSLADPKSGLPDGAFVGAILPVTLDTPMNRKWMADADFSTWTPLEFIAELMYKWGTDTERPESGSLIQIITKESKTSMVKV